jgi:hypothetical protein
MYCAHRLLAGLVGGLDICRTVLRGGNKKCDHALQNDNVQQKGGNTELLSI